MAGNLELIEIERETIGHALRDRRLSVPMHQRSYAWEEEHVQDLYQDLARAINDGEQEYFLGSLVVVTTGPTKFEVNDGQQRLATSSILIGAIRDYFINTGDGKTAGIIEREHLYSEGRKTHELTPRLRLNSTDHEFFERRVLHRRDSPQRKELKKRMPAKDSHRRISKAADLAAKHVATANKRMRL